MGDCSRENDPGLQISEDVQKYKFDISPHTHLLSPCCVKCVGLFVWLQFGPCIPSLGRTHIVTPPPLTHLHSPRDSSLQSSCETSPQSHLISITHSPTTSFPNQQCILSFSRSGGNRDSKPPQFCTKHRWMGKYRNISLSFCDNKELKLHRKMCRLNKR